ncbi:branched-chain amino acid aminotransferase [Paramicrobacterium sp. CJ85]|uniref:branched-chain amino acid aminotransferase n=1 Tax=Paramicrobacterium sp. CJ85 TaxID=3445355 RepID=UPI003F6249B8
MTLTVAAAAPAFSRLPSSSPLSAEERDAILAEPGFGRHFTDHMVAIDWTEDAGWHDARVQPYGPLQMDPASAVLHYAQEIFEGLKAYRHADGSVWTFRPDMNARRFQRSARRLALPELPVEDFLASLSEIVAADAAWIPTGGEHSLYLRPFMIANETFLGVRPACRAAYFVIASPAGPYFSGGVTPVSIWLSTEFSRAGRGGTGAAKCGGNYAASLLPQEEAAANGCSQVLFLDAESGRHVDELGGMNVFFVMGDRLVTPATSGSILEGVTRDSVIQLARDRGLVVQERDFTLDEWRDGVESGRITEVFACGTAAVITPIAQVKGPDFAFGEADAPAGEVTMSLRQELTDIQYGRAEDRHGWLYRLDS